MEKYPYPQGRSDNLPYATPYPNYILFNENEEIFLYKNGEYLLKETPKKFQNKIYLKGSLLIYYNGEKLNDIIMKWIESN
jgi:hypothetical protein